MAAAAASDRDRKQRVGGWASLYENRAVGEHPMSCQTCFYFSFFFLVYEEEEGETKRRAGGGGGGGDDA